MTIDKSDVLRRVRFQPYRKGMGPRFTLTMYATRGREIGYCLKQDKLTLFEGADFRSSPLHADDSDNAVAALMSFLTLRPGDTDPDYFADYTEAQHDFAATHAESLACEVLRRFGDL